jgi:hypothetical protein
MKKITAKLLLVFLAGSANAGIISDRATFEASLASFVVDDYENSAYNFIQSDAQMSSVLGETSYTATGHSNVNIVPTGVGATGQFYCAGCNGSFQLDFTSTSVGTSDGVYGVGFDFHNSSNLPYTGFVTYGNGSTENFLLGAASTSNLDFFGLTSNYLISSIHLGLVDGGATQSGYFGLDNLTIGSSTAVSEPASITLL